MLSLPDFREKQILFIQNDKNSINHIRFENDNVVFVKNNKIENRASCHKVFAIFIIGDITITTNLIRKSIEHGISIFLLKKNLETYAQINSYAEGNYLLRLEQYKITKKQEIDMSKLLIRNKIQNQVRLLKEKKLNTILIQNEQSLLEKLNIADNNQSILGVEGSASQQFFKDYFKELDWKRRQPRAKTDIPNLLLDIGYNMLFNFVDSLLRLYGFDNYKGFYHKLFFQRKSLACDIEEPFRCIIDKQLLKSYKLRQIHKNDFKSIQNELHLDYEKSYYYSRIFLEAILNQKEDFYAYIHEFYQFIMNNNSNKEFPSFNIKTWS